MKQFLLPLLAALIIVGIAYVLTVSLKKRRTEKPEKEEIAEPKEKGFVEKYCNDKENDSRRQLANLILIRDEGDRKQRGQDNST